MPEITWSDFERLELRVGTIVEATELPEARRPAWVVRVDFGGEIGVKKSSARITDLYSREELVGRQVLAVVNLPPKQIGPIRSECLVTGFDDGTGRIVLATPERAVPNGARLA